MCFAGTEPPQPEVIETLLGLVTRAKPRVDEKDAKETKMLSMFNDEIDDKPIVRSFLLQLLLRAKCVTGPF